MQKVLILRCDNCSSPPELFIIYDILHPASVRVMLILNTTPDVIRVVQSVPPVVTGMANPVNVSLLIIQGVFIWTVVAGLLQIHSTAGNGKLPATTILLHRPFAQRIFIQRIPARCALSTGRLLVF